MAASSLELFIDASTINTGLKIRDRELIEKYLTSKTYPTIHGHPSSFLLHLE